MLNYWLVAFSPCIRFFHRCDRFKSFNRFNEQQHSGFWSDDGYYLKGGVCLKYWQSYGIINLSGITKLSNCLRSQWFLGQRTTQQGAGVKPRSPQPLPALQSVALAPHEGLEGLEGHLGLEPGSSVGRAHYSLHLPILSRHLRPPSLSSCLGSPENKQILKFNRISLDSSKKEDLISTRKIPKVNSKNFLKYFY